MVYPLNKKLISSIFYKACLIRDVEQKISNLYSQQMMRCPTHLSIGQETVAAVLGSMVEKKDSFISTHRCHAHYLAKGGSLKKMIAELYGKQEGCSSGKGGSMHLIDLSVNFMGSSAIVGNSIPIGVGLSHSIKRSKDISIIFFGDGATEEGAFYESLNIASTFSSKSLFVCEDNLYSVYSPKNVRQPSKRNLKKICDGLDIQYFKSSDRKIKHLLNSSNDAINYVKKENKPALIEVDTYRFLEHCGPNNDDHLNYRSIQEIEYYKKKDSLVILKNYSKNILNEEEIRKINIKIQKEVLNSFDYARRLPKPKMSIAYTGTYAE